MLTEDIYKYLSNNTRYWVKKTINPRKVNPKGLQPTNVAL